MNAPSDSQLDDDTHARIFNATILPACRLGTAAAQEQPRAIVVAGQPGVGRAGTLRDALKALAGGAVVIDANELREHYPGVKHLRDSHPYAWSSLVHRDASLWASALCAKAVEARCHLVICSTLSDGDGALRLVRGLQAAGYGVEVRTVARHLLESTLGIDVRFTDSLECRGWGRYVPSDVHALAYGRLPENLDRIREETGAETTLRFTDGEAPDVWPKPGVRERLEALVSLWRRLRGHRH